MILRCTDGKLLLASASQDKTLRIWTIQASSPAAGAAAPNAAADQHVNGSAPQAEPDRIPQASELAQMIARQAAHTV